MICITLPNAKDVTIKRSKLLSTLLITCLIESTWNMIMKTTPIRPATTKGNTVRWEEMPKTLAPVPQVGTEAFNRALYVPKGRSLWAARESTANVTDAPILGCQGGWF